MLKLRYKLNFLRHQLVAKTRHGVHSPFVYTLVDEVIYDFSFKTDYLELANFKLLTPHSKTEQNTTATSREQNTFVKQIDIRVAQLLYRLAKHFLPKQILAIGMCSGIEIAHIAKAIPAATIKKFNSLPSKSLQTLFDNSGSVSGSLTSEQLNTLKAADWVVINAKHSKHDVLNYLLSYLPTMQENALVVLYNIYHDNETKQLWQQVKALPQVTLSIDLFWLGLLFSRSKQAKEHFKIRF